MPTLITIKDHQLLAEDIIALSHTVDDGGRGDGYIYLTVHLKTGAALRAAWPEREQSEALEQKAAIQEAWTKARGDGESKGTLGLNPERFATYDTERADAVAAAILNDRTGDRWDVPCPEAIAVDLKSLATAYILNLMRAEADAKEQK